MRPLPFSLNASQRRARLRIVAFLDPAAHTFGPVPVGRVSDDHGDRDVRLDLVCLTLALRYCCEVPAELGFGRRGGPRVSATNIRMPALWGISLVAAQEVCGSQLCHGV